jgi:hypothetical protein
MLPLLRRFSLAAALVALPACGATGEGGQPSVESALLDSCKVNGSTCTQPAPHYADISGILDRSCNPCHTGVGNAPWALTDYEHVSAWAESIQQDLSGCTMPPLDGGITMTASERLEVMNWVQCGAMP